MEAIVFIPLLIVAITQMFKMALPQISGWITILIAILVGIGVALLDTNIGVQDITIAQGVIAALEAIGIATAFGKAGGGASGDEKLPPR
jgi:hypothetical protein